MVPSEQVGAPPGSSAQPLVLCSVSASVRTSVATTFWASEGPLLVMATVYVSSSPALTGSGASDLVMTRSAAVSTEVVSAAVSLAALVSVASTAVSAASLPTTFVPGAVEGPTVNTSVRVSLSPAGKSPTVQVSAPSQDVEPPGMTESRVTPAGKARVSVRTTPEALDGPRFSTLTT